MSFVVACAAWPLCAIHWVTCCIAFAVAGSREHKCISVQFFVPQQFRSTLYFAASSLDKSNWHEKYSFCTQYVVICAVFAALVKQALQYRDSADNEDLEIPEMMLALRYVRFL